MHIDSSAEMSIFEALTTARLFDLEQPRTSESPIHPAHVPPGYQYLLHRRHEAGNQERRTSAAGVIVTSDHAGTHIDALCHQAETLNLYGMQPVAEVQTLYGFHKLGIETVDPIVTRGLLIDLVRHRSRPVEPGRWISAREIREAAEAQGVDPRRGDVVLVRTGAGRLWKQPESYHLASGVDRATSEWLASVGVRAVGADNMGWDWTGGADPALGSLPGHLVLLARAGIFILENLYLEDLGEAGVVEFVFVCLPLKLNGATGSPVRPIALAPAPEQSWRGLTAPENALSKPS